MSRRVVLVVGVAALIGAGILGVRTYDYVQHDPRFCQSCHLMGSAFDKWETSAHRNINCHACHVQSLGQNAHQLFTFLTLRPQEVSKHAVVDYTRCGACHLSHDPRWKQVADTAGHKIHFERLGFQCVDCHSKGVHRFVRPTDTCDDCHGEKVVGASAMTSFHCTTCHDFLASDHDLKSPQRSDCLTCHEGMALHEGRFDAAAPMQFPCQQCHKPHSRLLPTVEDCTACHKMEGFGLHTSPFHGDCQSCHRPHLWRVEARVTCERCHTDRAEHYPDLPCAGCHDFHRPTTAAAAADTPR